MPRRDTDADRAVEMPFGKYKGWLLEAVPDAYLTWLMRDDVLRSTALRRAISAEWSWRQAQAVDNRGTAPPGLTDPAAPG